MESPVAAVKSAFQPSAILKWAIAGIVGFAILDLFGVTDAVLRPVTFFKAKFARPSA